MATGASSATCERADEQKILKSNQARLIKAVLSGNYLKETFVLMLSVLKQSRNWQRGSGALSERLRQNKTRQTRGVHDDRVSIWAYNSFLFDGSSQTAANTSRRFDTFNKHKLSLSNTGSLDCYSIIHIFSLFRLCEFLIM